LPRVLLGRGRQDAWYSEEKYAADLEVLNRRAARVETCLFDGGHEWTPAFREAAAGLLAEIHSPEPQHS
jgi:hypothetical protein